MSLIDRYLKVLEKAKKEHASKSKEFARDMEKLEALDTSETTSGIMAMLLRLILKEADSRELDIVSILELTSLQFSEQNKIVSDLRNIISPLVSEDESVKEKLKALEERIKELEGIDVKVTEFLKFRNQERDKVRKKLKALGRLYA